MPNSDNERQYGPQYKLIGKNYVTADLLCEGHREVKIRGRLSRRRHAVLQAAPQPAAACAG